MAGDYTRSVSVMRLRAAAPEWIEGAKREALSRHALRTTGQEYLVDATISLADVDRYEAAHANERRPEIGHNALNRLRYAIGACNREDTFRVPAPEHLPKPLTGWALLQSAAVGLVAIACGYLLD